MAGLPRCFRCRSRAAVRLCLICSTVDCVSDQLTMRQPVGIDSHRPVCINFGADLLAVTGAQHRQHCQRHHAVRATDAPHQRVRVQSPGSVGSVQYGNSPSQCCGRSADSRLYRRRSVIARSPVARAGRAGGRVAGHSTGHGTACRHRAASGTARRCTAAPSLGSSPRRIAGTAPTCRPSRHRSARSRLGLRGEVRGDFPSGFPTLAVLPHRLVVKAGDRGNPPVRRIRIRLDRLPDLLPAHVGRRGRGQQLTGARLAPRLPGADSSWSMVACSPCNRARILVRSSVVISAIRATNEVHLARQGRGRGARGRDALRTTSCLRVVCRGAVMAAPEPTSLSPA